MNHFNKVIILFAFITSSMLCYSQYSIITLDKAGKFSSKVKGKESSIVSLKINGFINGNDIMYFKSLPNLENLDLSEAHIVKGGKKHKIQANKKEIILTTKEDDIFPEGFFFGLNKLTTIFLPNNIKNTLWDYELFQASNIQNITILSGSIFLDNEDKKINKLTIGKNVKRADIKGTFIEELEILGEAEVFNVEKGDFRFKNCFIGKRNIEKKAPIHYIRYNKTGDLILYNSLGCDIIKEGTTIIGNKAFFNDTIKEVKLPKSLQAICPSAFAECKNLTNIFFNTNTYRIGASAFSGCKNLIKIDLPTSLKEIDGGAFAGCKKIETITIPESVIQIGSSAFSGCENLSYITLLPKKAIKYNNCFYNDFGKKYLKSIFVPTETYEAYMSSDWNIYSIAKIGKTKDFNFQIKVPGTLIDSIGVENLLSVKKISISGTLDETDLYTIKQMSNLKYINIEKIKVIQSSKAQKDQKNITEFLNTLIDLSEKYNKEKYKNNEISDNEYINSKIGNNLIKLKIKNINVSDLNGFILYSDLFKDFRLLETLILPQNTIIIEDKALNNCTKLKNITIPNTLLKVGDYAFGGCVSLEKISFPQLKELGDGVFGGCTSLISVELPEGLYSIGSAVFSGTQIESITLPSSIMYMSDLFSKEYMYTSEIKEIHCKMKQPPYIDNRDKTAKKYKIYIPKGSLIDYRKVWGDLFFIEE